MSTTHRHSPNPFPPPHRAPASDRFIRRSPGEPDDFAELDPADARSPRVYDGWPADRIRKQARHWRRT